MESVDVRVLRAARDWHAAGHRLMLVTVVKIWVRRRGRSAR